MFVGFWHRKLKPESNAVPAPKTLCWCLWFYNCFYSLKGCFHAATVKFALKKPMTATREGAGGSTFSQKLRTRVGMEACSPSMYASAHQLTSIFPPSFNSSGATSTETVTNNHRIRFLTFICQSWAGLSALGFCSGQCLDTQACQCVEQVACPLAPFHSQPATIWLCEGRTARRPRSNLAQVTDDIQWGGMHGRGVWSPQKQARLITIKKIHNYRLSELTLLLHHTHSPPPCKFQL